MVPERFERYIEPATRARVAALASVPEDDWMQDWPLEVADPSRLDEFLDLLNRAESDDDRFALMELVLYSLDEADPVKQLDSWPVVQTMLEREPLLYAREIIYWSLGAETDEGTWKLDYLGEDEGFPLTRVKFRLPVKRVLMERFPFAVVFVVESDIVRVVAVEALLRRPGYWRARLRKP